MSKKTSSKTSGTSEIETQPTRQIPDRIDMSFVLGRTCRTMLTAGVMLATTSTTVAAQEGIGSEICGTPLAQTVNQAAPLIVGTLMIGAAILAYILHTAAAFPKDPQSVQTFKNWRNRAAISAITTPLFAFVIEMFIGFTGTSISNCVSLVPFF